MASVGKNYRWLKALAEGKDLHSINAELMFGDKWAMAGEPDCEYYKDNAQVKCSCPKHKELRTDAKTVTFSTSYGATKYKLASLLGKTPDEAQLNLNLFFQVNPEQAEFMVKAGNYAITNGHIIEPVFGRIRFFDKWKLSVGEEHGGIRRQAANTPIQSAGSALLKISGVLMRRHIIQNNLQDKIALLLPYHDEWLLDVDPVYAEYAKNMLQKYMRLAAKLGGFTIGADAKVGPCWAEVH